MKRKLVLSIVIMGSFGLYVLFQGNQNNPLADSASSQAIVLPQDTSSQQVASSSTQSSSAPLIVAEVPAPASSSTSSNNKTTTTQNKSVSKPAPTPAPVVKKQGMYTDGTYTGSVADAYYGNVQVQVAISNSKITNVKFLDYPQDRSTSRRINSAAMPTLIREAISIQSANVDKVSGASDTSAAFKQSLANALAQAKA